tara:strand:- start:324 stop:767 length:444 start_codon:yes stop_codon:yes gene_type:complete
MSSFSTASAGMRPPSSFPGTMHGNHGGTASSIAECMGGALYQYTGAGSVVTPLDVTGRGIIEGIYFGANATTTSSSIQLIIDGVTIYSDSSLNNIITQGYSPIGGAYVNYADAMSTTTGAIVPFNTGFSVSISCNINAWFSYKYYLT